MCFEIRSNTNELAIIFFILFIILSRRLRCGRLISDKVHITENGNVSMGRYYLVELNPRYVYNFSLNKMYLDNP